MKKITVAMTAALFAATSVFAYNPPFGGENIARLTNPELLSGAASATGGPNDIAIASSLAFNPALISPLQRISIDMSGTFLANTRSSSYDDPCGFGFQTGVVVPTRWAAFGGSASGIFSNFHGMHVRDVFTARFGGAKEIIENLSLGVDIYTGLYFGEGGDFSLGADVGALYRFGTVGPIKNLRVGASLLNVGKPASDYDNYCVTIAPWKTSSAYPGIITPRASVGATLFEAGDFSGGLSTDVSFPSFQDVVLDIAFGLRFKNFCALNLGWQANLRELSEDNGYVLPSVGFSFKMLIESKKMAKKNSDWKQSEFTPSIAWQNLYGGIHAFSAGARLDLGMIDRDAPEIIIGD